MKLKLANAPSLEPVEVVRSFLEALTRGPGTVVGAAEAMAAFTSIHPLHKLHGWCQACRHEHALYADGSGAATECQWSFCQCPGFLSWGEAPPPEEARKSMVAELQRTLSQRNR